MVLLPNVLLHTLVSIPGGTLKYRTSYFTFTVAHILFTQTEDKHFNHFNTTAAMHQYGHFQIYIATLHTLTLSVRFPKNRNWLFQTPSNAACATHYRARPVESVGRPPASEYSVCLIVFGESNAEREMQKC